MPNRSAAPTVPLKTRVMWGFGGLADNFMFNTLVVLGMIIYVDYFRVPPALAGIALFIPRFVDAITDPWIGNISDNAKTRWGRRRPFMLVGVILSALIMPLLWIPPGVSSAGAVWFANIPFLYLALMGSVLAVTYTLFVVPYSALGFELTPDYDERTRVIAWRMYIGLFGSLTAGWLYRLANLQIFENEAQGAFWISAVLAVIVIAAGVMPVIGCREDLEVEKQPKIRILDALAYTLTNRPFLILFVAYLIIILALFTANGLGPFLMIYYVFGGDRVKFGDFGGTLGTLAVAMSYVSLFFIGWLSRRAGKRRAMITGMSLAMFGAFFNWFAIDPRWPWMMFPVAVVSFLGMQGCWLMIDSMVADICDDDELRSGRRREGMFSAVKGFALKLAQAITALAGGVLLTFSGFDAESAREGGMTLDVALRMKTLMIGIQVVGLLIAIAVMWKYPISRQRAEQTRRALERRRLDGPAQANEPTPAPVEQT
jgi:glycoside/pentoside/hexuronide:cation symporter, GPH family